LVEFLIEDSGFVAEVNVTDLVTAEEVGGRELG
jgi:hypothetical protein